MNHIGPAWDHVSKNLAGWIVFTIVALMVVVFTCGLGALLVGPNWVYATKRAIERGAAPDIGDLFVFDFFVDYFIYFVIVFILAVISSVVPVIGTWIVQTLVFWALPLIIDGRFSAIEALQASFHHVKGHFFDVLLFVLVTSALVGVAAVFCFLPVLVAAPVVAAAMWLYYLAERANILAAAAANGLNARA